MRISSSVSPLLITSLSRWEPASGAKVRLLFFTSWTLRITSKEKASIRREGREMFTPFPLVTSIRKLISSSSWVWSLELKELREISSWPVDWRSLSA